MAIALLTLELYLPMNDSLKGKRGMLKPLIARLRRDFNVSVCEADAQDVLTRSVIEVACVSQNGALAYRHLQQVANSWSAGTETRSWWISISRWWGRISN